MEPTTVPEESQEAVSGATRRNFIRGIAAAGASTAAAVALEKAGVLNLETDAAAQAGPNSFSDFRAIAASDQDVFQVPEGFRADVIIGYDDEFSSDSQAYRYGYNNDYLAFFPLPAGSQNPNEGLIFVNHEYPSPFFQHGNTNATTKTPEQIQLEQDSVGNAIVHIKRDPEGVWRVVSPSRYNRRITGRAPEMRFTGPLAGQSDYTGIGTSASGSLANCSGGITPWGTALSCEENYQDYGSTAGFGYGWTQAKTGSGDYYNGDGSAAVAPAPGPNNAPSTAQPSSAAGPAKYGWVCEHDPYDPSWQPRKHTALGRFRHENTTFRAQPNRPFVLYMGDDVNNGGVYKFVSTRSFVPGQDDENRRILEQGTLYIARWDPEGRRRFNSAGTLQTVPSGTGYWREVTRDELVDCQTRIRAAVGATEFDTHYATNRPEDLEVDEDGTVYIALTNNSTVNDVHGSIRRVRESGNDATAVGPGKPFIWEDFATGGPTGSSEPGREGFSSPDNLVFDKAGNLWVVTDISSSALNTRENVKFHKNNAVFMVPRSGPNAGVAFRFANMPIQSEGTGPYFTPDEETLFVNVQHPGEESNLDSNSDPDNPATYADSYWPRGNRSTGQNPAEPLPATVAVTRVRPGNRDQGSPVIPAPATSTAGKDATKPRIGLLSPRRQSLARFRTRGMAFRIQVDEPVTLRVTAYGRLTSRRRKAGVSARGALRRFARQTIEVERAGTVTVRLRPKAALRMLLRREQDMPGLLAVRAVDSAGNRSTRTKTLLFK